MGNSNKGATVKIQDMEKYTSAVTLSDMEVFVYPELMYSLVLANIMSPNIWRWLQEDTFKKLEGKTPYRKLMRMRQFIMDEYEFNLDIETWGMTSKTDELNRFAHVIPPEDVAKSNALFGYQGDKYYFDVDIRRHFGLDKYDDDAIPYWKTETVETMDGFQYKQGYTKKAGECVSLSSLYAAAAFIVCGIPLDDIYMVLTPLHSQNFIDIREGVITNNRRVITKPMWFNGTAISMKAQRAMRNENITIVSHNTGSIHCLYKDATIDPEAYKHLSSRLGQFLAADFNLLIFSNFLRDCGKFQKYFQFCHHHRGQEKFINAETLYKYEHSSRFRIADETYEKLLDEVSSEDYSIYKITSRMCCEQLRAFMEYENIDLRTTQGQAKLKEYLKGHILEIDEFVESLVNFMFLNPLLPSMDKEFTHVDPIKLDPAWSREEVIEYLQSIRHTNPTVDLAFYAYRDMETCDWEPFVRAALQRNPVSIERADCLSTDDVCRWLGTMVNESVYDGKRLAQPDEVANFRRADGVEKAFTLANIIRNNTPDLEIGITIDRENVIVKADKEYRFVSSKGLAKTIKVHPNGELDISG